MAEESDVDEAPLPPTSRLRVSSPTNSLSNSFKNTPQKPKLMDHQAGVSRPEALRSSAGGTSDSETQIFQQRLRLCIPGEFGIQAQIITVSTARFPPEDARLKK